MHVYECVYVYVLNQIHNEDLPKKGSHTVELYQIFQEDTVPVLGKLLKTKEKKIPTN